MSSYQPLARKKRPKLFCNVIGQPQVVTVLENAIASKNVPPCILFSGTRGVGKTTLARLVAQGLNCTSTENMPCGDCASCQQGESHLDILEFDAASHTGVEDVRHILDSCQYRPLQGKCKVYIIDEVHMLSKSAFNALLKTLEEPPATVVFILATTEPEKIPLTIISRCLHLPLKPVSPAILNAYYTALCQDKNIGVEPAAMERLVMAAQGSVRDGLSLLDQAFLLLQGKEEQKITSESLNHMLGCGQWDDVFTLVQTIIQQDAKGATSLIQTLQTQGYHTKNLLQDFACLIYHLTQLCVNSGAVTPFSQTLHQNLVHCAKDLDISQLGCLWQMCLKTWEEIKISLLPDQALEMAFLRMIYVGQFPSPQALVGLFQQDQEEVPLAVSSEHVDTTPAPGIRENSEEPTSSIDFFQHPKVKEAMETFSKDVTLENIQPIR